MLCIFDFGMACQSACFVAVGAEEFIGLQEALTRVLEDTAPQDTSDG